MHAVESFVILLLILIIIDMSGNMRIMGILQLGTLASSSLFSLSLFVFIYFFFVLYNRRWFNIHLFIQAYILMYFVVAFLVIWAAAAAVGVCLLLLWCHTHTQQPEIVKSHVSHGHDIEFWFRLWIKNKQLNAKRSRKEKRNGIQKALLKSTWHLFQ